jgi:hypothetical protein
MRGSIVMFVRPYSYLSIIFYKSLIRFSGIIASDEIWNARHAHAPGWLTWAGRGLPFRLCSWHVADRRQRKLRVTVEIPPAYRTMHRWVSHKVTVNVTIKVTANLFIPQTKTPWQGRAQNDMATHRTQVKEVLREEEKSGLYAGN